MLEKITKLIKEYTAIAGVVVLVAGAYIQVTQANDTLQALVLSQDAINGRLDEMDVGIQANSRMLRMNSLELRTINPPRVATYDAVRSGVEIVGCDAEGCHYTYEFRLWRTSMGVDCGIPEVMPWVINHNGITHPVTDWEGATARATSSATILPGTFTAPTNAREGTGEFFMSLRYPDCTENPNEVWDENTIFLPFEIVEHV